MSLLAGLSWAGMVKIVSNSNPALGRDRQCLYVAARVARLTGCPIAGSTRDQSKNPFVDVGVNVQLDPAIPMSELVG
jgi:hypothetical protein